MRIWTRLAALALLLWAVMASPVSAAASEHHLSKVVMLVRHGIAAPAADARLPGITGKAWPQWPVGPGQLSERGALLLTAQWAALRGLYLEAGLLPVRQTQERVFVRADNTPASRASAEALLRGLAPGSLPAYAIVNTATDPLFEPVQAGLAIFNPAETALAILDHVNGDFSQLWETLGEPMALLDQLTGPLTPETCRSINLPADCRLSDMTPGISIMDRGRRVEIRGGLGMGAHLVDLLLQEYAQWPQQDAAWGQANAAALRKLLPVHSEISNTLYRTPLIAGIYGGPLLRDMALALYSQHADPRLNEARCAVFVGNESNLAAVGALLGVSWQASGFPVNALPPGAVLVMELWEGPDKAAEVRFRFFLQGLDFMHAPLDVTTAGGYRTAPAAYGPALLEARVTLDGRDGAPALDSAAFEQRVRGALAGRSIPRITFLPEMVSPQAPTAPSAPVQP